MRTAFLEQDVDRTGLASTIAGATDMATSKQVDVIVFSSRDAAKTYVAKAAKQESDQTFRHGRYVLSFGNPPLVGEARQGAYEDALKAVIG
jgi:methylmalonyl-CoA mutase cobalamin-binding subunit